VHVYVSQHEGVGEMRSVCLVKNCEVVIAVCVMVCVVVCCSACCSVLQCML